MSWLSDRAVERLRERTGGPAQPAERYVLEEEIGRGGMGRVWLATDVVLGRDVAVKVLDLDPSTPGIEERMRDEARILARLEHPGIVPVHDLGRTADDRLFYVMKRVEGETLGAHLDRVRDRAERLRIFERLCDPVAFAHARGVVHRDLKPDNVMIGSFGEVLVMDWGVAKVLGGAAPTAPSDASRVAGNAAGLPFIGREAPTDPGTILGTPGFMAPEQARGEPVDARADVYALGMLLARMLDLEIASGGDPREVTASARSVPRPLRSIVAKALAPRPGERYATAAELADDVARYRDGRAVSAHRESALERLGRWARRYQAALWLVAAYLVMRAMVALWIRQTPAP